MYPYRGIVHTNRQPDSISTRRDDLNTLTCQSAVTNDAPWGLMLFPVTWNHPQQGPTNIYGYIYSPMQHQDNHGQQTLHRYVKIYSIVVSYLPL